MGKTIITRYRRLAYLAGFFLNLHLAIAAYINSSFLSQFLPEDLVGLVFSVTAAITIFAVFEDEYILKRFGSVRSTSVLTVLLILLIIPLTNSTARPVVLASFIAYFILGSIIKFNLDIYLENFTDEGNTGKVRGTFLSIINLAWLCSPLIASYLARDGEYWKVYLASGTALFPLAYLLTFKMRDSKSNKSNGQTELNSEINIKQTIGLLWSGQTTKHSESYKAIALNFILQVFYAVMVIYSPIYLHNHIGLPWPDIGIIFTVMLLPFVLIQMPFGRLADRVGEKTLASLGVIIMGIATFSIAFITSRDVIIWAAILFASRLGAATIEVLTDTHLFKYINTDDLDIIAISRNMSPLSYIITPIFASIFISFFQLKYLFVVLALIIFWGLKYSLAFKDSKNT
jgi:MFS family permease